jgi:hypothetical protein
LLAVGGTGAEPVLFFVRDGGANPATMTTVLLDVLDWKDQMD